MNLLFLLLWFAVCADQDARGRKVSNALTFGGTLFFLTYLLINGTSWLGDPAPDAWWALLFALVMTLPGYALNRLGAGDVKLLVALALSSDYVHILGTLIGAGIAMLIWLILRQKLWGHVSQGVRNRYPNLAPHASNKQPFVPFLLIGFVATALSIH
jgi:prepilin peptidase CpaA